MKKKVHYADLEDMKKYIKDLNLDYYESTTSETDKEVINFVRKYYDDHLPIDVTAWSRVNKPKENLIYGSELGFQISFIRDRINRLLYSTYEEYENNPPMVISTHYSKSVKLPVYQLILEKYDIEIILRCNFYDWKVSVKSKKPIDYNFMNIFDSRKIIPSIYCEGFPTEKVYGSFEENHSQFTIEISSDYNLYTFFFLLKRYLEKI